MEANVNNPHDHFFRYIFTNPKEARAFLAHFLPPKMIQLLDLNQLVLESGSYIDEKLREHLTDILYTVPTRSGKRTNIYCLFEHKSTPESAIHLQILRYSYERWQADTKAKQEWQPIVAIVFYHGKATWKTPLKFQDCFKNVDPLFLRYIPNFEYVLVDTSQYGDEMLREVKSNSLQASLFLLKYIYDEHLSTHLDDVIQPLTQVSQAEVLDLLWAMLTYLTSAADNVSEAELRMTLTEAFRETEEIMMTIAEKWRLEGEELGIKKGEELGIKKGTQNTIVQILESRFGSVFVDLQQQLEQCSLEQLDELVNLALEAETLDEFAGKLDEWRESDAESANELDKKSDSE